MASADDDDPEALLAAFRAQLAEFNQQTEPPAVTAEPGDELPPRERVALSADPRLIERLERLRHPDLERTYELVRYAGELPIHLDPGVWGTGFLEVHDSIAGDNIQSLLHEPIPQALLRDLFRPPFSEPRQFARLELPLDPGAREAYRLIQEAKRREVVVPPETIGESILRAREEWRTAMTEPWKPYLDDDAPRRETMVIAEPSVDY